MDEKEKIIMSIIDNEFEKLSINNLINELKRIPQYDFKNTRIFILKLFRDIDSAMKNSKNRIKKYFQSLKISNDQIIKKIYFQSRNKPLLSKYNTKDSTNFNENIFYQTQANAFNNKDYTTYENIQSIKNLKSSEENSSKENEEIFTKNYLEKKYFSGNNGIKGGGLKYKKKIDLGNKSLSEFKIKSKKKISNFNIYKLYHKAHNDKNKNNKSNSINANKIELSLNANNKESKNDYLSNSKIFRQINLKKKNNSLNKKITHIKLIKNNYKEKDENFKYNVNNTDKNNNYDNNINNEAKIKDNKNELDYIQEKNPFKDNNNNSKIISNNNNLPKPQNNNIIIENSTVSLAIDIINFIDNMKNLQKNIINKNPNIKEMKYNFEKNKTSLYQKAIKLSKIENSEFIKNDLYKISNTFSILIKNKINNNINYIGNENKNKENTKELNMSIINLKKTIEDIKNNSKFLTEQLKSEVNILNNKIKQLNEKEKENENALKENITIIKNIYDILLSHCKEQNNMENNIDINDKNNKNAKDKNFKWYGNEIIKTIEMLKNKNKNKNINIRVNKKDISSNKKDEKIQADIININEIKNDFLKNILEIINLISPFIFDEKEKEKNNLIIENIKINIEQNRIKEALSLLKLKIKELIIYIENLQMKYKIKEKEINKTIKNKIIPKKNNNISFDEDDEENINDKNNFLQLNSTLLGIQNDLIQKIENKQEEIEKIKKDLKDSIQLNDEFMSMAKNQKGQDVNVFAEKYKYLLDLFNSEQKKVKFLQNEYMNLLSGLSNYVNNGEEIVVELKKMWNCNPVVKTNFEIVDPEFPDIDPINETDLLTEKS